MGERIKKAIGVKGDFKTAVLPMMNYSYANIFMGGAGYIISMYFMVFLTDVVNLPLNKAGIIVMIATVWDAVTDPVMGIITDRTRSKYGKHRVHLLLGIPLLVVSYSLLWNAFGVDAASRPGFAMLYFVLVYMLYKTAYTVIAVPHTAMLPELAPEYDLRTQYNSVGYIFNSVGMVPSFLIVVAVLSLFGSNDNLTSGSKTPFLIIGVFLSICYGGATFATFKTIKEADSRSLKPEKLDIKYILNEYRLVFANKSFRQYFFMSVFYQFATGFYANTKVYFIKYLANQYGKYALFNAVAGVAEASAFPLNYALTMKFGKKKCGSIVTPLMIVGLAIGLFIQPDTGNSMSAVWFVLMLLSMILYPFGMSGLGFVTNNIFPDLTDVDEMITGRRREGVISTFNTLIKKSIGGVMAAIVGFTLQSFGLVTGDTVAEYEKATGALFTQSAGAVMGVRLCVAVIPILASLVSLYLLHKFRMTKDDHALIRAVIAEKKENGRIELTQEQTERLETISGKKMSEMWIGKETADI
ncbi:MAG: MFS transporter [Clostridiales bacterium]|nr:MFS transporter [Clostridiales bacterium]